MTIAIEKNVAPPQAKRGWKYPLGEMEVGDSFFIAGMKPTKIANAWRNYRPMKFTARTVTKNGVNGVRVWRIA